MLSTDYRPGGSEWRGVQQPTLHYTVNMWHNHLRERSSLPKSVCISAGGDKVQQTFKRFLSKNLPYYTEAARIWARRGVESKISVREHKSSTDMGMWASRQKRANFTWLPRRMSTLASALQGGMARQSPSGRQTVSGACSAAPLAPEAPLAAIFVKSNHTVGLRIPHSAISCSLALLFLGRVSPPSFV
eukprot:6175602-Pleurochrysis_carterae.AAC.2